MLINKLSIAEQQLERALCLFFNDKDYISSITLSGAADEILGKIRESNGELSAYNELKKLFHFFHKNTNKETLTSNEFNELANGIRNGLKHFRDGESMDFKPEQEAVNILDRALENYFAITGKESDLMKQFKNYKCRPTYET